MVLHINMHALSRFYPMKFCISDIIVFRFCVNIIFSLSANCHGLLASARRYNFIWQYIASGLNFACTCLYSAISLIPVLLSRCWSPCSSVCWQEQLQQFVISSKANMPASLGSVSRVYCRLHQLRASPLIPSCGKMLQNYFLVVHVSFQELLSVVRVINLSSHTRAWVMAPVGMRQKDEAQLVCFTPEQFFVVFFFRGNLYVKLPVCAINSHPEFSKYAEIW